MPSYSENPESLSHLGLNWYRDVTNRQTDRIMIASTRLALHAVERKNHTTAMKCVHV